MMSEFATKTPDPQVPRRHTREWPRKQASTVADPTILKSAAEDNLLAPSSFIANAHNEIYAFYTEKRLFEKNIWANRGGGRPPPPPSLWIRHWASSAPGPVLPFRFGGREARPPEVDNDVTAVGDGDQLLWRHGDVSGVHGDGAAQQSNWNVLCGTANVHMNDITCGVTPKNTSLLVHSLNFSPNALLQCVTNWWTT